MTAPAIEPMDAMRRRAFVRFSAGALATAVVGCTPRDATARRRASLIYAVGSELDMEAISNDMSKYLLFLPLVTEDENGDLQGCLAEHWEHSPDRREWTFHLRRGVRWHDGHPLTTADVQFTLDLLGGPEALELAPGEIESVNVIDAWTVTVRIRNWQNTDFMNYEVILPKHLLEHLDPGKYTEWDFWRRPVGCGPYRFVRRVPQTIMEFEANPDYFRGKRRIQRVVYRFGESVGLTSLQGGEVDILLNRGPVSSVPDPAIRVYYGYSFGGLPFASSELALYKILWNQANPLFRDARVRRAMTLAINRRELASATNLPASIPIADGPFTLREVWRGELPAPLPFDLEASRRLLDAAGWRVGENGIRSRDGKPFHFTLLLGDQPGFAKLAVYVQEALRQAGVSLEIQTISGSVAGARLRNGQFDATLTLQKGGLERLVGDDSPIGYRNADVARLLERLRAPSDPADADEIRRQLTAILRTDPPATILFPRIYTIFARRRVRGLSSPWRADPSRFIDELWLDDRSAT